MAPDGSPALDPGKASTEGGDNVPPDTLACWEDKLAALDLSGEAGPVLRHGEWKQVKKGEDLMLVKEDFKLGGRDVSCFCLYDGHNGLGAAELARDRLLGLVQGHLGEDASRAGFLSQLPKALAQAFEQCDASLPKGETSGTTATVVVIEGWTVTVSGVGDSRVILDTPNGGIVPLTVDHRLETSVEELKRIEAGGSTIGRLTTSCGVEVGPLRSWPGGLCLSRSIGDSDAGPSITATPHVRQVEVPRCGGRIIMGSDGLWDAISNERAARIARGKPAPEAARHLVKKALEARGLRDDVTCLVIDLLPPVRDPLPKLPKSRSFLNFVKKHSLGSASSSSLAQLGAAAASASVHDLPSVLHDHDLLQPAPSQGERTGGTIHGLGAFCSVCGRQMVGVRGDQGEVSVRAGSNFRCPEHSPTQR